ncbi:MAG: hypothetical protein ABL997_04370 [Planctomycetota bacterium]
MNIRVLIAAAVLLPLLSVGLVVIPGKAAERWREMTEWADRTELEWEARDFTRTPLTGEATAGSAFDSYLRAIDEAGELSQKDAPLLRDLRLHPERVSPEDADAFDARWQSPIGRMRGGAHCADARPRIRWKQGIGANQVLLLPARDLVNACVIAARRHSHFDEQGAAVDLLIDAATFATDLQQSPIVIDQMIASSLLAIVVMEAFGEDMLARIPQRDLERLARALELLDERCRPAFDGRGEALLLANTLRKGAVGEPPTAEVADAATTSWHYGWSKRWAAADSVMMLVDACEALLQGAALPWRQREELLNTHRTKLSQQGGVLLVGWSETMLGAERTLRIARTHLRLLRMAVEFRRTGTALPLQDPFGDDLLQQAPRAGGARFWSCGGTESQPLERTTQRR